MPIALQTAGLLVLSNVFMTFAWYAHLRNLGGKPWFVAAMISWGISTSPAPTRADRLPRLLRPLRPRR